jgi:rod shape-determining protein MreC
MRKNFISRKIFLVAVIVAVCGLLVFFIPVSFFSPARRAILVVAYPLEKILHFTALEIRDGKDLIFSIGKLKKDNNSLREENEIMTAQQVELDDLKKENDQLRKQLDLVPRQNFNLQSASVIGQDATGSNSWILIDQGRNAGLAKGMAVIVSKGNLVGRVDEIQDKTAKVNLVTHPESLINAEVSEGGARGIIRGEFGLGLLMDMVVSADQLEKGNKIFTSGIGGDIPRGFFIGTVKETYVTSDGLFKQATVIPAVEFSRLQFVFVVKSEKGN